MPAPSLLNLPAPLADSWEWQLRALCREEDNGTFFHPDNERGTERSARVQAAKQICRRCIVRSECLRHALSAGERYGTWGGLSEDERRALHARNRKRQALGAELDIVECAASAYHVTT
ncbi:WhiB family transcriptional regulator [Rhodococcus sp. C26F]